MFLEVKTRRVHQMWSMDIITSCRSTMAPERWRLMARDWWLEVSLASFSWRGFVISTKRADGEWHGMCLDTCLWNWRRDCMNKNKRKVFARNLLFVVFLQVHPNFLPPFSTTPLHLFRKLQDDTLPGCVVVAAPAVVAAWCFDPVDGWRPPPYYEIPHVAR